MRRAWAIPPIVLVGTAAMALLAPPPRPSIGLLAYDTYSYFVPNVLHALRALHGDAGGLLWIPYQNCGQPFFANPLTGSSTRRTSSS